MHFFQIEKACSWKKCNRKLGGRSHNRRSLLKNSKFRAVERPRCIIHPLCPGDKPRLILEKYLSKTNFSMCRKGKLNEIYGMQPKLEIKS